MAFDRRQAEDVFERALEIDGAEVPTFDRAALQRLADELGVSESAMSQAIAEATVGQPGLLNAVAEATMPVPIAEVHATLDSLFRLRGLIPSGSAVWEQGSGWWPDLYRFTARTPIGVSLGASDSGTSVRLTARLDRVWRTHLVAALLAPLAMVFAVLRAWPQASVGLVFGTMVWMACCAWTYQLRREAVQRRLAAALADVARPAYRLQPW